MSVLGKCQFGYWDRKPYPDHYISYAVFGIVQKYYKVLNL